MSPKETEEASAHTRQSWEVKDFADCYLECNKTYMYREAECLGIKQNITKQNKIKSKAPETFKPFWQSLQNYNTSGNQSRKQHNVNSGH